MGAFADFSVSGEIHAFIRYHGTAFMILLADRASTRAYALSNALDIWLLSRRSHGLSLYIFFSTKFYLASRFDFIETKLIKI